MTREYLGLAGLDAALLVAGEALLYGLGFVRTPRAAVRYAGLAFLLAWTMVGVVLSLALVSGLSAAVWVTLVACALAAAAGAACGRTISAAPAPSPVRGGGRWLALGGAAVLAVYLDALLRAARVQGPSQSWDAWGFWLPKAKAIFFFGGLDTGIGGFTSFSHADYPPLLPGLDAAVFHFAGNADAAVLPAQEWVLTAAFLAAVAALLAHRVPQWLLWPPLAALVLMPSFGNLVGSSLGDQPLSLVVGLAMVTGALWLVEREPRHLALCALFLLGASWVKSEGLLLGVLLAVALLAAAATERPRRLLSAAALVPLPILAILPWKLWLSANGVRESADYSLGKLVDPGYLGDRFGRLETALGELPQYLLATDRWLLAVPLALLATLLVGPRRPALAVLELGFVVVGFFGLTSIYWISPLPLHWYIETSAERVFSTLVVASAAVLPLLLSEALAPQPVPLEVRERRPRALGSVARAR